MVVSRVSKMLMSLSLWNMSSLGMKSKSFLKVYKIVVEFRRAMFCLLNYGLECNDVINVENSSAKR
jgi:hypothetical protein